MRRFTDAIGGFWIAISLFLRCKGKRGSGSYLAWREEAAFGKPGQFRTFTKKQKRRAVIDWSRWAWRNR